MGQPVAGNGANRRIASWTVVIMTYDRPAQLEKLLADIERERAGLSVSVHVYDDCSSEDYGQVVDWLEGHDDCYVRAEENHGLMGHWRWFSRALQDLRETRSEYYLFLQDDMRLCSDFFQRILTRWKSVDDTRKIALNPLVDEGRKDKPCWTGVLPERHGHVDLTGWVDAAFLCERRLLEELEFRIDPIPSSRWERNPKLSSGVGWNISTRLHTRRLNIYRTLESLVAHVPVKTRMHLGLSAPVRAVNFIDGEEAHQRLCRE